MVPPDAPRLYRRYPDRLTPEQNQQKKMLSGLLMVRQHFFCSYYVFSSDPGNVLHIIQNDLFPVVVSRQRYRTSGKIRLFHVSHIDTASRQNSVIADFRITVGELRHFRFSGGFIHSSGQIQRDVFQRNIFQLQLKHVLVQDR